LDYGENPGRDEGFVFDLTKEILMPAAMTEKATMKAVLIHSFGGPEVLKVEEVPVPKPGANDVLVRVRAGGVNPVDWKLREGLLPSARMPMTMGIDFSGTIEAVGAAVKNFSVGEEVFGQVEADDIGSYAEFCVAPESACAAKPDSLDHVHAAALPVAGLTAWQTLFDLGELQAGQTVLIHAAAGGVGSFAVQFAKWKKARVIGTASTQSIALVRELGADEVIDYRTTKFEDAVRDVDMVLDTVGKDTQERSLKVLKRGGIIVSTVQPPPQEKLDQFGVRGVMIRQKPNGEQLQKIGELVASGVVKVNIEAVMPVEQARAAQERSQTGHAHGKIVLQVA
jgi:NADPH:quinone reductase-like Zn-dependent oxidoreductase